ncbi:Uncharacterised protein [Vibrio cholerae]|nr:Uncharacterised protein [Vibrio cholerae]
MNEIRAESEVKTLHPSPHGALRGTPLRFYRASNKEWRKSYLLRFDIHCAKFYDTQ